MSKKKMRTIQETEDRLNSTYAMIGLGIDRGKQIEEFDPPLNELEIEIYHDIVKFNTDHPGKQMRLYMD